MQQIPIVILAAGESRRLGHPKQLLRLQDKTLLQHTIDTAEKSKASQIIVVLGAEFERIANSLSGYKITILKNNNWQTGLSSSINTALAHLRGVHSGLPDAIVFATCDQPLLKAENIDSLINRFLEEQSGLVVSSYNNCLGVPALFSRFYFDELEKLTGKGGAKEVIERHMDKLSCVDFPDGAVDIDTEVDWQSFTNSYVISN